MEGLDPQSRWELLKYEIRKLSFSKAKARSFKAIQKSLEENIQIKSIPNWEKGRTSNTGAHRIKSRTKKVL